MAAHDKPRWCFVQPNDSGRGRIERTASKRWRGSVRRVLSVIVYNLSCFTHGCNSGWVSGVLGEQALTGGAWLAALPCLVAVPAVPFFAVLADARGRKAAAFVVAISFIMSCFLLAWCGLRGLWVARAAAGVGGAGALALAPVYGKEVATRTRGLAAVPAFTCSCGILFAYVAGGVMSSRALALSMAIPPLLLLVSLAWLPETPAFLISVGRIQHAAKVMCWFEGSDFHEDTTDAVEEQEVRIRTSEPYNRRDTVRRKNSQSLQPMLRIPGADSNGRKTESACRELFHHRRTRRALLSCLVLVTAAAGSGAGAIVSFSSAVIIQSDHGDGGRFNATAHNFTACHGSIPLAVGPSQAGSMLCGTALVLGAAAATITVDKFRRKVLLIWSCSSLACCLALLGFYCDPRLRMSSWYHHQRDQLRIWPKRESKNSLGRLSYLDYAAENATEVFSFKNNYHELEELLAQNRINLSLFDDNFTLNAASIENSTDISKNFEHNPTQNKKKENMDEFITNNKRNKTEKDENISEKHLKLSETFDLEKNAKEKEEISYTEYDRMSENDAWVPIILLSLTLFFYNIGLGSVPLVIVTELFDINVRSLASSIILCWMWLTNFLTLRYYGTIVSSIGLHSVYYTSASVALLASIYSYFCVSETRGKSRKEIDESLKVNLLERKGDR